MHIQGTKKPQKHQVHRQSQSSQQHQPYPHSFQNAHPNQQVLQQQQQQQQYHHLPHRSLEVLSIGGSHVCKQQSSNEINTINQLKNGNYISLLMQRKLRENMTAKPIILQLGSSSSLNLSTISQTVYAPATVVSQQQQQQQSMNQQHSEINKNNTSSSDLDFLLKTYEEREKQISAMRSWRRSYSMTTNDAIESQRMLQIASDRWGWLISCRQERDRLDLEDQAMRKYFNIRSDEQQVKQHVIKLANAILATNQKNYNVFINSNLEFDANELLQATNIFKVDVNALIYRIPFRLTTILHYIATFSRQRYTQEHSRIDSLLKRSSFEPQKYSTSLNNENNSNSNNKNNRAASAKIIPQYEQSTNQNATIESSSTGGTNFDDYQLISQMQRSSLGNTAAIDEQFAECTPNKLNRQTLFASPKKKRAASSKLSRRSNTTDIEAAQSILKPQKSQEVQQILPQQQQPQQQQLLQQQPPVNSNLTRPSTVAKKRSSNKQSKKQSEQSASLQVLPAFDNQYSIALSFPSLTNSISANVSQSQQNAAIKIKVVSVDSQLNSEQNVSTATTSGTGTTNGVVLSPQSITPSNLASIMNKNSNQRVLIRFNISDYNITNIPSRQLKSSMNAIRFRQLEDSKRGDSANPLAETTTTSQIEETFYGLQMQSELLSCVSDKSEMKSTIDRLLQLNLKSNSRIKTTSFCYASQIREAQHRMYAKTEEILENKGKLIPLQGDSVFTICNGSSSIIVSFPAMFEAGVIISEANRVISGFKECRKEVDSIASRQLINGAIHARIQSSCNGYESKLQNKNVKGWIVNEDLDYSNSVESPSIKANKQQQQYPPRIGSAGSMESSLIKGSTLNASSSLKRKGQNLVTSRKVAALAPTKSYSSNYSRKFIQATNNNNNNNSQSNINNNYNNVSCQLQSESQQQQQQQQQHQSSHSLQRDSLSSSMTAIQMNSYSKTASTNSYNHYNNNHNLSSLLNSSTSVSLGVQHAQTNNMELQQQQQQQQQSLVVLDRSIAMRPLRKLGLIAGDTFYEQKYASASISAIRDSNGSIEIPKGVKFVKKHALTEYIGSTGTKSAEFNLHNDPGQLDKFSNGYSIAKGVEIGTTAAALKIKSIHLQDASASVNFKSIETIIQKHANSNNSNYKINNINANGNNNSSKLLMNQRYAD